MAKDVPVIVPSFVPLIELFAKIPMSPLVIAPPFAFVRKISSADKPKNAPLTVPLTSEPDGTVMNNPICVPSPNPLVPSPLTMLPLQMTDVPGGGAAGAELGAQVCACDGGAENRIVVAATRALAQTIRRRAK